MHYYFNCLPTSDFSSYARRLITKPSKDRWLRSTYEKAAKNAHDGMVKELSEMGLKAIPWDDLPKAKQKVLMRGQHRYSNPVLKHFEELPVNTKEVNQALLFYDRPSKFKQMFSKHGFRQEPISSDELINRFANIPERKQHLRKYRGDEPLTGPGKEVTFISAKHPDYTDIRVDPVSWEYLGFPKINGYIEVPIDSMTPNLKTKFRFRKWY